MLSPRSNFFARALLGLIAACTAGAAAPPAVTAKPPGLAPPQPSPQPAATTTTAPPAAAAAPAPAPAPDMLAAPMSGTEVIDMLDQTVDWYRTLATQQQFSTEPSDLLILYENRQLASQVTALAFDMARVDAKLLPKDASAPQSGATASSSQSLAQLQSKIDAQAASVQSEMDADRQKLAASPKKARQQLQAKIAELQGETDLLNTKKSILASIAGVVNGGASGGSATNALRAQIDAMATALPASTESPAPGATGGTTTAGAPGAASAVHAPAAPSATEGSRFGIWDVAANVFKLSEKMSALDAVDRRTAALQDTYAQVRAKVVAQMRALSARGDSLMAQADAADSATLDGLRGQLDALSGQIQASLGDPHSAEQASDTPQSIPAQPEELARCGESSVAGCPSVAWSSARHPAGHSRRGICPRAHLASGGAQIRTGRAAALSAPSACGRLRYGRWSSSSSASRSRAS